MDVLCHGVHRWRLLHPRRTLAVLVWPRLQHLQRHPRLRQRTVQPDVVPVELDPDGHHCRRPVLANILIYARIPWIVAARTRSSFQQWAGLTGFGLAPGWYIWLGLV